MLPRDKENPQSQEKCFKFSSSEIKRKISVHKQHKCLHCMKYYSGQYNLKMHILRMHSKVKPYSCSQCSKAFAQSSTLRRHWKVHSDEKSFREAAQFLPRAYNREHQRAEG